MFAGHVVHHVSVPNHCLQGDAGPSMYSPSLADNSFGAECLDVAYCRDVDNDYPADGSAYEIDEDYPVKEGATAQASSSRGS